MKTHELKAINPYFSDVWHGIKNFEVRKNDREFKVGDFLLLREYDPQNISEFQYLFREILCKITYLFENHDFLKEGYVILGIEVIEAMRLN